MGRRRNEGRETIFVLLLAGGFTVALTTVAMLDLSGGSLGDFRQKAMMSFDPGAVYGTEAGNRDGRIVVAALPPGFFVRVDGTAYPAADRSKTEIPATAGPHRVEVANRNGEGWVTRLVVPAGGIVEARPLLAGEIAFEGKGNDGRLFLDGRPVGLLPAILDSVAVGIHRAELRSDSVVVWQSDVEVRAGSLTRVSVYR